MANLWIKEKDIIQGIEERDIKRWCKNANYSFNNFVLIGKRERKRPEQILIDSSVHSDATSMMIILL